MKQKIRVGIELNHVIRNINRQIVKYYQRDYDESIDMDEVNYKDDVISTVCGFKSAKEVVQFLYEDYPLEVFGHANQMDRTLSRDLNAWLKDIENQEEYDIELFFYSMKEVDITIQSSYFFLSKIGSRIRKVVFPKNLDELMDYGDVFITANDKVSTKAIEDGKAAIMIKMDFPQYILPEATVFEDFKEFLELDNKNKLINDIVKCEKQSKKNMLSTWMQSLTSFFKRSLVK